jgi:hypothetical protein
LLLDKGGQPVDVSLRLPGIGPATVERLTAPAPAARSGVTFAGQDLDVGGNWLGPHVAQTVRRGAYGYAVAVPRYSAALVTLRLRPGALIVAPAGRLDRHVSRLGTSRGVVERKHSRSYVHSRSGSRARRVREPGGTRGVGRGRGVAEGR